MRTTAYSGPSSSTSTFASRQRRRSVRRWPSSPARSRRPRASPRRRRTARRRWRQARLLDGLEFLRRNPDAQRAGGDDDAVGLRDGHLPRDPIDGDGHSRPYSSSSFLPASFGNARTQSTRMDLSIGHVESTFTCVSALVTRTRCASANSPGASGRQNSPPAPARCATRRRRGASPPSAAPKRNRKHREGGNDVSPAQCHHVSSSYFAVSSAGPKSFHQRLGLHLLRRRQSASTEAPVSVTITQMAAVRNRFLIFSPLFGASPVLIAPERWSAQTCAPSSRARPATSRRSVHFLSRRGSPGTGPLCASEHFPLPPAVTVDDRFARQQVDRRLRPGRERRTLAQAVGRKKLVTRHAIEGRPAAEVGKKGQSSQGLAPASVALSPGKTVGIARGEARAAHRPARRTIRRCACAAQGNRGRRVTRAHRHPDEVAERRVVRPIHVLLRWRNM